MEAIGFTASLITLAATALNSTKVLYEFLSNIKDNPEELKNLRVTTRHLGSILVYFEKVKASSNIRQDDIRQCDDAFIPDLESLLADCNKYLSETHERLSKLFPSSNPGLRGKVVRASRLLLHERDLDEMCKNIQLYAQFCAIQLSRAGIKDVQILHVDEMKSFKDLTTQTSDRLAQKLDAFHSFWQGQADRANSIFTSIDLNMQLHEKVLQNISSSSHAENDQVMQSIDHWGKQSILDSEQQRKAFDAQYDALQTALQAIHSSVNSANTLPKSYEDDICAIRTGIETLRSDLAARLQLGANTSDWNSPSHHQAVPELRRTSLLDDDRFRSSLGRLSRLSTGNDDGPFSCEVRSSLRDLVAILDRIATLDNVTTSGRCGISEGCVRDELDRTRSIFQLTPDVKLATTKEASSQTRIPAKEETFWNEGRPVQRGPSYESRNTTVIRKMISFDSSSTEGPPCLPTTSELRNRKARSRIQFVTEESATSAPRLSVLSPQDVAARTSRTRTITWQTEIGRIDLRSRTERSHHSDRCYEEQQLDDEVFSTTVVLTPASRGGSNRQLVFRCQQFLYRTMTSVAPAILEIRNVRYHTSEIFDVASCGSVDEMLGLLVAGHGSLTDCDEVGRSLLGYALDDGNFQMVRFLLSEGADVDAFEPWLADERDFRPVLYQALGLLLYQPRKDHERDMECVKAMMEFGTDPTHLDDLGNNMAFYTIKFASLETAKAVLDYGHPFVSPNAIMGYDRAPLMTLVITHTLESDVHRCLIADKIALFLSRGADPQVHDYWSDTCLHRVLGYNLEDEHRKRCLFDNIVVPGYDGELKDILMLLITAGADVYATNDDGESPSDIASAWGHWREWCEALEECGYEPDEVNAGRHEDECWSSSVQFEAKKPQRPLLTFDAYLEMRKSRPRPRLEELSDDEESDDEGTVSETDSEDWFQGEAWDDAESMPVNSDCQGHDEEMRGVESCRGYDLESPDGNATGPAADFTSTSNTNEVRLGVQVQTSLEVGEASKQKSD